MNSAEFKDPTEAQQHRFLEIRGLVAKAQRGDRAARDRICREMEGLVLKIARRYARWMPTSAGIEDVVQGGFLGLTMAIYRWDEEKAAASGTKSFTTMAEPWIRMGCQRYGEPGLVYVPWHDRVKVKPAVAWIDAPADKSDADSVPLLSFQASTSNPEREVSARELLSEASTILKSFPGKSLDLLMDTLLESKSTEQLSEEHGLSAGSVRTMVSAARREFRQRARNTDLAGAFPVSKQALNFGSKRCFHVGTPVRDAIVARLQDGEWHSVAGLVAAGITTRAGVKRQIASIRTDGNMVEVRNIPSRGKPGPKFVEYRMPKPESTGLAA